MRFLGAFVISMKRLMIKRFLIVAGTFLMCSQAFAASMTLAEMRPVFQQVYADLQAGRVDSFVALPADMRRYPLYPWLEYAYLKQSLGGIPDAQLLDFALRNPNSLMSDDIYTVLAKRLADKQAWKALLDNIPASLDSSEVQCYRAQALAATGQKDAALEVGQKAWMAISKSMPDACVPVTALLRAHVRLSTDDYLQRIRAAVDKNQVTLATQLAADLPPEHQAAANLWIQMRQNPKETLTQALQQPDSSAVREAILDGLERIAKKETQTAESVWQQAQQKFKFTPAENGRAESTLGMYQAVRFDAAAIPRLATIPDEFRTEDGNLWLTRIAARTGDWAHVLQASRLLKYDNERDASSWTYWQARALEQTGKQQEAASLYASIAAQSSYYGFLAADRLGQAYQLNDPVVDRTQRIIGIQKLAVTQRAFEWFAIGNREQGRQEWFRLLENMDQDGKLAAAEFALRAGDPNLAIWTLSRAKQWDAVNLRFPLVHTDMVQEQARVQGIQPAWIMGVMRRESAFDPNAASGADAFGLMQLILPTARHVASKLGLTVNNKDDVLQPATNIQLGSAYLRDMLAKFGGNYAQATAAYNAGPGRPFQWEADKPLNADQWVESIPFNETRDYVQAVMAYTTIYDYKLNGAKGLRLSERLLPIPAASAKKP